jgi:hypothetical protein
MNLKDNYGPAGNRRVKILEYHMSEFLQNCLGDDQKYLLLSGTRQSGIFGEAQSQLDI